MLGKNRGFKCDRYSSPTAFYDRKACLYIDVGIIILRNSPKTDRLLSSQDEKNEKEKEKENERLSSSAVNCLRLP